MIRHGRTASLKVLILTAVQYRDLADLVDRATQEGRGRMLARSVAEALRLGLRGGQMTAGLRLEAGGVPAVRPALYCACGAGGVFWHVEPAGPSAGVVHGHCASCWVEGREETS